MEQCIIPKDIIRQRFNKKHSDGKASRLSFSIARQTSRFLGNVSLIKVNIKTINRKTNLLPLEHDSLKHIRERLLQFIEKACGYIMNDKIKDSFHFQLDKNPLSKEDEDLSLEDILKKCSENNDRLFEGDVIHISFLIIDVDMEYQMIKNNLEKFKSSPIAMIYLVKQQSKNKEKMKNRLLKIEENAEDCLITLYTIRGDVKEAYPIEMFKSEPKDQIKIHNVLYYPLSMSKVYEQVSEGEEHDASQLDIYFLTPYELSEFLSNIKFIKDQQKESDEDIEEDHLLESIQELGTEETENLDEDVQVGQILKLEARLVQHNNKGEKPNGPRFRSPIEYKVMADTRQSKTIGGRLVQFESSEGLPKLSKNMSEDKTNSTPTPLKMKKGASVYLKMEAQRSSVISKAVMEKKELDLDAQEFEVKVKGMLGISYKRILRLSDDFEFHFFKKEKGKYFFTLSIPINNLAKVTPKKGGSFKVYFYLKADKKQQKPLKVTFKDQEDLKKFFRLSKKIAELFNSAANSFQTEKERTIGEKLYPWLMGPKDALTNIHYEQGKIATMQFNVINMSNSQEPQVAHLDLLTSILSLKSVSGIIKKKLNIRNILYCGKNYKDTRILKLLLKNKKYKLLFSDNQSRLSFESAIYNTTLSHYKIPSKQPFEWEPISVFSTTFNAGFGAPPADLNPWLGKTNDCDLIAIGMQEANTAEWVQAIQEYYSSDKFTLVALVTMWKMLLCVFVSSKYSNYITNVEIDSKATGIAKVIGNKGGVAVSFRILESSFCFLSCHLAAQPERMPTRKANFYNLLKSMRLGDESLEMYSAHDYFFFMGDTNFRLDYDFFKTVETISEGEHVSLLPHDQYRKARDEDNFMTQFTEGKITFKPTYRRNRDDTGYSNKRNQAPSWTDRVFIKSRPGHPISIREYNSAEMFFLSDHRPVYGIYKCEVQPPYLPRTPIYSRPAEQKGVIKLKDLELYYDFGLYAKMGEFEAPLTFPLTISVGFRAKFLHKAAVTMPLELKGIPSSNILWNEEMLPLLYSIVPDYRYLRNESLLAIVKISNKEGLTGELVTGQADISLEDLMVNRGEKTEFKVSVYFYGRCFGSLKGTVIYDLN